MFLCFQEVGLSFTVTREYYSFLRPSADYSSGSRGRFLKSTSHYVVLVYIVWLEMHHGIMVLWVFLPDRVRHRWSQKSH